MIIIDEEKYELQKIIKPNQNSFDCIIFNREKIPLYCGKNIDSIYQILNDEFITLGNSEDNKIRFEHFDAKERKMILNGDYETCESVFGERIWLLQKDKDTPTIIYNSHNKRKIFFQEPVAGMRLKSQKDFAQKFFIEVILNVACSNSYERVHVYLNSYTLMMIGVFIPSQEEYIPLTPNQNFDDVLMKLKKQKHI